MGLIVSVAVGGQAAAAQGSAKPLRATIWGWPTAPCHASATPMPGPVLLQVRTQQDTAGHIVELRVGVDHELYARASDLRSWTGSRPSGRHFTAAGQNWYALDARLAGRYRFDACTQTLWLAPLSQVLSTTTIGPRRHPTYRLLPRATGAAVSADVQQIVQSVGPSHTTGVTRVELFGAPGVGDSGWLFDTHRLRRLGSRLEFDDPESRARLILGDSVTRTDLFAVAPVRFGGLQWGTDFALDPQFDPLALPSLSGSAALPGTLQLYKNGILQSSHATQGGPFDFTQVPVLTGTGMLEVVTRNALGRQVRVVRPFYHSVQLLKPGLTQYSAAAGWLREDYTLSTDRYTDAFASAGTRYGLSGTTTAGARLQVSGAVQDYSLLLAHAWPRIGLLMLQGTAATGRRTGVAGTVGVERNGPHYGGGASLRLVSAGYAELGNPRVPMRRLSAYLYAQVLHQVNLHASYANEAYRDGLQLRLLGLGLTANLEPSGWFVNVSVLRAIPGGNTYDVSFTHRIGRLGSVSLGGSHDPTRGTFRSTAHPFRSAPRCTSTTGSRACRSATMAWCMSISRKHAFCAHAGPEEVA